jgi:hypothetical protein
MAGLIGQAISNIGSTIGNYMLQSNLQEDRQEERRREREEDARRQAERDALYRRTADQQTAAARSSGGGADGGLPAKSIGEGGEDEAMLARAAGLTVPELRALRQYSSTGDKEPFKRDVTRYSRDQDDTMAGPNDEFGDAVSRKTAKLVEEKAKELPPGFEPEIRAKMQSLARIEESYRLGKNYKEVTEGRQNEFETDVGKGILSGAVGPGRGAASVGGMKGNAVFEGDSNTTRNRYSGESGATAVGQSVITENRAQAGKASADARATADGKGKVDITGVAANAANLIKLAEAADNEGNTEEAKRLRKEAARLSTGAGDKKVPPSDRGGAGPAPSRLKVGDVVEGYRFMGGNPNDPKSWTPASRSAAGSVAR